ncbi:MAG: hypothetical protein ABR508_02290 [Candidatus Baltobacteraceae bacterium]
MKTFAVLLLLLLAAVPAGAQSPSDALIAHMIANVDGVRTYTAAVHTNASVHAFISLNPSLDGMYYHKEPDRNKVVYTSGMPFVAQQFSKLYPHIDSAAIWKAKYVVSVEGDSGGFTTFKLVPRLRGRIDHIDAKVDDRSANLTSQRWNYGDGGYAQTDLTYSMVQGHPLVTAQSGKVEVPKYSAEFSSTFKDFKINVAIPDSVFAEN